MQNISQYVMYALVAIGLIVFGVALVQGDSSDPSTYGAYSPLLTAMYAYLIISIVLAIGAFIYNAMIKPESLKETGIGVGAMLLVFIISYALADDTIPAKYADVITSTTSKWTGAGLYAFYILFIVAVGSILVSGIMNLVKK